MESSDGLWQGYTEYVGAYRVLIGDQRTERTFRAVMEGIIAGESVLAARIARFSPSAGGDQAR